MLVTLQSLWAVLRERFGGRLSIGAHYNNPDYVCAFELLSVVAGLGWTENPNALRTWDLRGINDMTVDDTHRAEHLLPVLAAYAGSMDWPRDLQFEVLTRLIIGTIRDLVPSFASLSDDVAAQCRAVTDLDSAILAATRSPEAAREARIPFQAMAVFESVLEAAKLLRIATQRYGRRADNMLAHTAANLTTAATSIAPKYSYNCADAFARICAMWLEAAQPAAPVVPEPEPEPVWVDSCTAGELVGAS